WALCQRLGFEHVLFLDVLLSGLSVLLEFWALAALRIREPGLRRPYRVPGGVAGCVLIGLPPLGLIIITGIRTGRDTVGHWNSLAAALAVIALGPALYGLARLSSRRPA